MKNIGNTSILKYVIKRLLMFCKDTAMFVYYLLNIVRYKSISRPIKMEYSGTVAVLANGPSLKEVIPRLAVDDEFRNSDFIVMNFFAFDNVFFRIKPKHYCLADPIFMQGAYADKKEQVLELFKILQEKVDWNLNIYVPGNALKNHLSYSGLTNSFIKYIPVNTVDYSGYEHFRFFFYKKGLAMPLVQSVANMAIYIALDSGYSLVNLYGVDHDFFVSLCVNENNQVCTRYKHFYDNHEEDQLKPIIHPDGCAATMTERCKVFYALFRSHEILADYAKFLNIRIINRTKRSMIDSYERM
jgi:hypothetical protein